MYTGIVMSFLDSYLTDKKIQIRTNPETGEGSLFAPPQEKGNLDDIDSITEDFCALLKQ